MRGFLKTELFEIRIGNLNDHVATVSYNTLTGAFEVTPLTGSMDVTITKAT